MSAKKDTEKRTKSKMLERKDSKEDDVMLNNSRTIKKYCMLARVASMSHKFDDMILFLGKLIDFRESIAEDFTMEERYLISVGYKNYIGDIQTSARVATAIAQTKKYQRYG